MDTPRNPASHTSSDAPTLERRAPDVAEDATIPHPTAVGLPRDPYVNTVIDGRYRVLQILGEGGMGIVYLAQHTRIDKRLAIKVLRGGPNADHGLVQRFLNEARAASKIGNPHIVDVADFGTLPDGATYFVMEHLAGESLAARLNARGSIPWAEVAKIAHQIAEALHAAHEADIVHRDLKPDNVMLVKHGKNTDFVKVLDFGIAKVSTQTKRLTVEGDVFGTPEFMSPEQASGTAVDRRTDVYALGVMMYEMVAGVLPFTGTHAEIMRQHLFTEPVPLRKHRPEVPAAFETIVMRCLEKKRERRYATMNDLLHALDALHGPATVVIRTVPERTGVKMAAFAIGAIAVLALGGAIVAFAITRRAPARDLGLEPLPTMAIVPAQSVSALPSASAAPSNAAAAPDSATAATSASTHRMNRAPATGPRALPSTTASATPSNKPAGPCKPGETLLWGKCQGL